MHKLTPCSISVSSLLRLRHLAAASLFLSRLTLLFSSSSGVNCIHNRSDELSRRHRISFWHLFIMHHNTCYILHILDWYMFCTAHEQQTCSSLLRRPRASPMERMTPGRVRAVCPRRPGPLGTVRPYGWERVYGLDIDVMTVGWTIHCKSWLVVMALMVGIKALLEPGMSTLYFWKERRVEKKYLMKTEIHHKEPYPHLAICISM